jgi:Ala-tRNA(Pro) deacylase
MFIRDYLTSQHVPFEVLLHRPVASATRLAQSVHVPGRSVAKVVVIRAGERTVLAVLPATHRVDLGRLSESLGEDARLATPDELADLFADYEPGALPPFGRHYGFETVVDTSLSSGTVMVFEANTRFEGVRMKYDDYEAIERPTRIRFATSIDRQRPSAADRKAG